MDDCCEMFPPRLKKQSVTLPRLPPGRMTLRPRVSHHLQCLGRAINHNLRINGKQTLLVGLTIVAGSKLGGSGRAAKSPIKHLDGEYKEIGAAYKVAGGQVSKIEGAPWSAGAFL